MFLSSVVYYFLDLLISANVAFFTVKKRSLIYDLIVAYHYRSLRLLLSHMRVAPVTCTTTSAFTEANFCRNSLVRKYQ